MGMGNMKDMLMTHDKKRGSRSARLSTLSKCQIPHTNSHHRHKPTNTQGARSTLKLRSASRRRIRAGRRDASSVAGRIHRSAGAVDRSVGSADGGSGVCDRTGGCAGHGDCVDAVDG